MHRSKKHINYAKAINAAARYVDQHYNNKITLSDIAATANISAFHFGRIFQNYTGETPGEFLQRQRLLQAYKMLLAGAGSNILDIALSVGYENHSSFSRAFRKYFGVSPKEALPMETKFPPNDKRRNKLKNNNKKRQPEKFGELIPEYVQLEAFKCYGIKVTGYSKRSYIEAVEPAFNHILELSEKNSISLQDNEIAGIPLDNPSLVEHDKCQYMATIKSANDLSYLNLDELAFETDQWAVFDHTGPYTTLWQTWNRIYQNWVIQHGVSLRNVPAFEVCVHTSQTCEEDNLTQIYIPLEND